MKLARTVAVVALPFLLVLLAFSLFNLAAARWQYARNPAPGQFYLVYGKQMHLNCSGAGTPTVVIEAGASANSLGWQAVQSQLSRLTRVCTYDRAGHGWSEPRTGLRDAETIVRELHSLLELAGVKGPLVLAGHSAGGLYVREYSREFPADIAGVALIDSSSPVQIDELPGWRQSYEADKNNFARALRGERIRVWSGWERLLGRCHDTPSKELQYLAGQYDAQMCRPEFVGGDESEFLFFEATCQQAARLRSFGNVPLLIISQDPDRPRDAMTANAVAGLAVWSREQEALKALSPLSWRVIARGSGHGVQHDRPGLVVAEMTRLITLLRGGPEPAFGSSKVE
jgi:Predicted hydrolases or acyltransferases (alpha/beta hydrolase superfamily)